MRAKTIATHGGRRQFAIVFEIEDEVMAGLTTFAREQGIEGAYFTGIGALSDVKLGFWDQRARSYRPIPIREQVEVLTLAGNVALEPSGTPKVHAHLVVGKADGSAHGGHLLEGHVRPTLEVMLVEVPSELRRTFDPTTGLALLDSGT